MPSPRPETSYGRSKDLGQDALPSGIGIAQAAASCTQSPAVQWHGKSIHDSKI